jgi:para-aminobenzoate synthetase component 1
VIVVEHGPDGRPALFAGARRLLVARRLREVAPALAAADRARAAGAWVAGWIGYEAGHAFEPRLAAIVPRRRAMPLLVLGLFDAPQGAGVWLSGPADGGLEGLAPAIAPRDYARAFDRVQAWIAAGDTYQVNLTFPLEGRLTGDPAGLYRRLRARQPAAFGAFADFGVGPVVVSLSPELFFRVDAGTISARPMKGTAPRDPDADRDAALAAELRASVKARAENLMIVDLLRNDIGRLARVGSVRVPELYRVETLRTVHQMTSLIRGDLAAPPALSRLVPALFPCGSVTGAPKIRAMEIIRAVEAEMGAGPRGVYCGAVGWMAPGGDAVFSVAIRTLSVTGDRAVLNVGGGVVQDSTAAGEWEEALWKARFAQDMA